MGKVLCSEWEKRLNPKRFRPTTSKGTPQGWNPFDSDYARLSMSAPFRRLQDKAQVFPLEPNDFVRTRLTHSLEVSSVARSLGVMLEKWLLEEGHINNEKLGHIPSILATASLAHDIGNPPFGHFGEECIKKFFATNDNFLYGLNKYERADLENFDGNVQGLRLLLRLGLASDEYSYNLTFPTLATIIKYPKDSIVGNKKEKGISFKKYGYYQNDKEKYEEINLHLGLSSERHPLCFLLESADDICYSVSDIEDGFKKETVTLEYLLDTLNEKKYADDDECKELRKQVERDRNELIKVKNSASLIVQNCRVFSQRKMIISSINRFKNNHEDIITGNFKEELIENSPSAILADFFKNIAYKNFTHKSVVKSEILGETVLTALLKKLASAVLSKDNDNDRTINGKLSSLISNQARSAYERSDYKNDNFLKLLMVIDFVAGMTDSYALSLYRELHGVS